MWSHEHVQPGGDESVLGSQPCLEHVKGVSSFDVISTHSVDRYDDNPQEVEFW